MGKRAYFSCILGEVQINEHKQLLFTSYGGKWDEMMAYTLRCLGVDPVALAKLIKTASFMDGQICKMVETICDDGCSNLGFKVEHRRTILLHFG